MTASIGILNVGAGDTKIVFDPANPQDMIRAARIVKDMLRRGYALLVEVDQGDGSKKFQRVHDFDESKCEYVIADLDPGAAQERTDETDEQAAASPPSDEGAGRPRRGGVRKRGIPATEARGVAVARSAGG